MALKTASAKVLANKGVPVEVNVLKREDGELAWPPRAARRSDDTPVTEERFVRLGNLEIADLEDLFDGLDNWQNALRRKAFDTCIATLMVVWADDPVLSALPHNEEQPRLSLRRRALGTMLVDTQMDDYAAAIGGAFMLANGVDPRAVGKALEQGIKATQKSQERLMASLKLHEELNDIELGQSSEDESGSTSQEHSPGGSEPVESSTSSGD